MNRACVSTLGHFWSIAGMKQTGLSAFCNNAPYREESDKENKVLSALGNLDSVNLLRSVKSVSENA